MDCPLFRFAPSPNGLLHAGHAYSALLNYDMARATGGRFRLRIEDIDRERCLPEYETAIYEDLTWLGLRWEQPVRRQSDHMADYGLALHTLISRGMVYPCFCARSAIRIALQTEAAGQSDPDGSPIYPGTCRALKDSIRAQRLADGAPHVWRISIQDAMRVCGPLGWAEMNDTGSASEVVADPLAWGDTVVARRDILTSYHLSVVVDDALEGITHVVRGNDLYHATSVHRLLQDLLGLPAPIYRHHRLILDPQGRKLSKSIGSMSMRHLREEGCMPGKLRRQFGLDSPPFLP